MSRPQVADDRKDRLEELVDEETQLPASALSFDEQLDYLLEAYVGRRSDAERLSDRVEELKRRLEEKKNNSTSSGSIRR